MTYFKEATREALEFLRTKNNNVGVIATVDERGQPYASPVYYVMGQGFDLHFLTSRATHKAKNIEKNDKIAFSAGAGPEYLAVMIRGRAVVTDVGEQREIFPALAEVLGQSEGLNWPLAKLEDLAGHNLVLYKLVPESVTFLNINSSEEPKSHADHLYHLMG
jgi:nitroimidazol reductase NimA-like FMN-containing flavoprotein (pyridoxamine 5'-phosphate oxidase superfamily)